MDPLNLLTPGLEALRDSAFGTWMAESAWAFPALETVHVLAIALVVGTIAQVDLRLLGLVQRQRPVRAVIAELLPYTWAAFALAVPTGLALFSARPVAYLAGWPMRLKLLALLLAGLNMLVFHLVTQRGIAAWDQGRPAPAARLAGALSLLLWVAVVLLGRWIGFVK